jgi:hypothetical protein
MRVSGFVFAHHLQDLTKQLSFDWVSAVVVVLQDAECIADNRSWSGRLEK